MNNTEAIKRIEEHIYTHHIDEYPHFHLAEALNMAIDALKKQESQKNDIKFLFGCLFSTLEQYGYNPWEEDGCVNIANKYQYTKKDYRKFFNAII